MNDKLSFILGVHCHQPVGNFGWVIEEAFEKSYKPFLETLAKYEGIKVAAHYSGPLLEWIQDNAASYFDLIQSLVGKGQLEIVGGGFYEPILMTIPRVDRIEQIEMLSVFAEHNMGMRPKGVWLTERIWEPSLPTTIRAAGMQYTVADDTHFLQAGISPEDVGGYFLTEDEGVSCAVFPIDQTLRYAVPFKQPEESIKYLRGRYDSGDRSCCSLLDDGEKFGLWPGTHKLLYTDEMWLSRFFDALLAESDWLNITLPIDYLKNNQPRGLVYLPTASYFEMGQWTLSPNSNRTLEDLKHRLDEEMGTEADVYVKGGFFRNFFMRYPESNHMHKRMVDVSNKIHRSSLEGLPRERAKKELFQAQCNCGYWHGVFGGLYLPHLRDAIYEHLIKAESIVEGKTAHIETYDLDIDGKEEVALRGNDTAVFIAPHDGGSILEIDDIGKGVNISDTLARRPEAYHVVKETQSSGDTPSIHDMKRELSEEDKALLVYDRYRKTIFRDAMFHDGADISAEILRDLKYEDISNIEGLEYIATTSENQNSLIAEMSGETLIGDNQRLSIRKNIVVPKSGRWVDAQYFLSLQDGPDISARFATNLNLFTPAALGSESPFAVGGQELLNHSLLSPGTGLNETQFRIRDPYRKIDLVIDSSAKATIIWHPIETLSQSESGFDRNYQASSVWYILPISMVCGEELSFTIKLSINDVM